MTPARVAAVVGAIALLGLAVMPIASLADRLLPHAIVLWDDDSCASADASDHAIFAVAAPVLAAGEGSVQILSAHPLGLTAGAHWRSWIVPVARGADFTGALGTDAPPAGWSARMPAAGATVSGARRAELDFELWPGNGDRVVVQGILVTYRTTLGLTRVVRTPTRLETRVGGCT